MHKELFTLPSRVVPYSFILRLYDGTQRIVKDPSRVSKLFSEPILEQTESIDMLVGLPICSKGPELTSAVVHIIENVATDMTLADEILKTLLSIALLALREPSFHAGHWRTVLNLPQRVVKLRIERLKALDTVDSAHVDTLLNNTKKMLVEFETQAINVGGKQLEYIVPTHAGNLE